MAVNLKHLEARLVQSGHWDSNQKLSHERLLDLLGEKIKIVDFELAKNDVADFIKDKFAIALWSQVFFIELTQKLKTINNH